MAIKVNPDPIAHLGGRGGGLSVVGSGAVQTYDARVLALAPIAYWPLDEATGTVAHDQSGHHYDAVWQGYQPDLVWGVPGIGDGLTAIRYGGGNGYGSLDASAARNAFKPDEMTFALWAKPIRNAAHGAYYFQWGNGADYVQASINTATWSIEMIASMGGSAAQATSNGSAPVPDDGAWHHVAFTVSRAQQQMKVYVDGKHINDLTGFPIGVWGAAPTTLSIGCHSNTYYNYKGDLQKVALFDKALTGQQIKALSQVAPYSAPKSILAFGDSKIIGTGDTDPTHGWVYEITQRSSLIEAPTRIGHGGWTVALYNTASGLGCSNAEMYIRIDDLWQPDYIVVNLGVNELGGAAITPATWQTNMSAIVDALHAHYPAAPVYIDRVHRDDGAQNGQETLLDDTWIPAVIAAGRSGWCHLGIDERTILINGVTSDGLHPNHAGYVAMAQARLAQLGL